MMKSSVDTDGKNPLTSAVLKYKREFLTMVKLKSSTHTFLRNNEEVEFERDKYYSTRESRIFKASWVSESALKFIDYTLTMSPLDKCLCLLKIKCLK